MLVSEISHLDTEPTGPAEPARASGLFRQQSSLATRVALPLGEDPEAEEAADLQSKARARRLKALSRIADEADEIVKSFPPRRQRPVLPPL